MTRFDASTPDDRRSLVADAIDAHHDRGSVFCTLEADSAPSDATEPAATTPDATEPGGAGPGTTKPDAAPETEDELGATEHEGDDQDAPAWIQFSDPQSQLNLDCTDEEYGRITDVLATAPAFTIDEQTAPEDIEGRNLRVTARADADRIADVVDRLFVEGFGYDEDYRLWAAEI